MTALSQPALGDGYRPDVLPVEHEAWRSYAEAHPAGTVFHTPRWGRLVADCYGFRPFAITVRGRGGEVVAGLPFHEVRLPGRSARWVAGAYADECGPLIDDTADLERLRQAVDLVRQLHGIGRVEVRGHLPGPGSASRPVALLHKVPVSADSDVRASYRSTARRGLKRAEANGVRVRTSTARADLVTAYYRLHVATRRRLGVPAQPRRYFALLWERFVATGNGFVELAEVEGQVVAGAVFLVHGGTLTYKYGGSCDLGRETGANFALFDGVLRRAGAAGASLVDLGRTDHADAGLQRFKQGWGATTAALVVTHLGPVPPPAVRELHPAVRNALRRLPPLACRLVGEGLYRYAA